MQSYPSSVSLSTYILERLKQLGCKEIFGVPGDFNLEFLDYIEDDKDLHWAGNANELNAAYAVDGYARIKRSLGCIVTTYGVGELSALNGIAGAMAERVPILHLVGVPGEGLQARKAMLHHTLGDGVFSHFSKMSAPISATMGALRSDIPADKLGLEVDRVLGVALVQCRPVYLTFPTNLFHTKIPSSTLSNPLPHPHSAPLPATLSEEKTTPDEHQAETRYVAEQIQKLFEESKDPVMVVDACAERFGIESEVKQLADVTGMMFFLTPMAKGVLNEADELCGGTYIGANSFPAVRDLVEKSDLVIAIGSLKSDFNTGSFSWGFDIKHTIELHSTHTEIGYAHYPRTTFRELLPVVIELLGQSVNKYGKKAGSPHHQSEAKSAVQELLDSLGADTSVSGPPAHEHQGDHDGAKPPPKAAEKDGTVDGDQDKTWPEGTITQAYLWPRMGVWFEEGDVIVSETGTSNFGILDVPVPKGASVVTQVLWGSIGYSVGATLGCALAAREQGRRAILFVGDGSLQLGVQELGTMLRNGVKPWIFVLNNDGYEIERCIHGAERGYNDIQPWDHQLLLSTFSPPKGVHYQTHRGINQTPAPHKSYRVSTRTELDDLLKDEAFNKGECIQLVELMMPRGDVPRTLRVQAMLTAKANSEM